MSRPQRMRRHWAAHELPSDRQREAHRPVNELGLMHPYIIAEERFKAGILTVAQAVAMVCSDPDYRAECELTGRDKRLHADAIVRDVWAPVLVRNIQESKANG
jgi:hypothetical protein